MKITTSLFVVAFTLFTSAAQADRHFPGFSKFAMKIQAFKEACATGTCAAPFSTYLLVDQKINLNLLSPDLESALQRAAELQVFEWQDGVLENDFVTDGRTILEKVIRIFENKKLVGYKITYIQKSWDISACDFKPNLTGKLEDCTEGIIRESSFVGKELLNVMRNHDEIAEFHIEDDKT
jgi:hypothetical protein